ncbi:MAG: trypsin-like peptidase domain-containing protein [Caldilineaceae bacterium]
MVAVIAVVLLTAACDRPDFLSNDRTSADARPQTVSMAPTQTAQEAAAAVEQARQVTPPSEEQFPSQQLLAALYDQILPSVVDIEVTVAASAASQGMPSPFGQQAPNAPVRGEGSGWVYDNQGHIVTNNHVIADAEEIIVNFADGSWTRGEVVATDPQADLAVLQITPPSNITLRPLTLANPDAVSVGNWVLAFGTPFGLDNTMTLGIISATGRGYPVGAAGGPQYTLPDVVQTDAAINPGNSGGPLLNLSGEVVGVNFAINSPVRANSGVGFAIPVSIVNRVVPALIEDGSYAYPYLGISGGTVTPQLTEQEDIPQDVFGVWVSAVPSGGPGAEAGLQEGDIITAIEGTAVRTFDDLVSYLLNDTEVGQEITLTVLRDGETIDLPLTVQERPGVEAIAQQDEAQAAVSIEEAIQIARETVSGAGLMDSIDNSSAELQSDGQQSVWVVSLSGGGRTAVVVVDATTGDVLGLNVS